MDRVIKSSMVQGVLLLVVLMGLGGWPSWLKWGQDGMTAMCGAAVVCTVALVVSLWVCSLGQSGGGTSFSVTTILSVTGIRILVTLVGALMVYMLFEPKRIVFVGWLMLDYFALLILETRVLLKLACGPEKPVADQ